MSIAETFTRCGLTPSVGQLSLAKTILGEERNAAEHEIQEICAGPGVRAGRFQEVTALCGRKSGKTEYVAGPLVVHLAGTEAEETGIHLLCAPSKSGQAEIVWDVVISQLQRGFPGLIANIQQSEGRITLHNGNVIVVASANFRHLRGPKYKVVVIDEACFFVSDDAEGGSANPLEFILDSIVGGMVAVSHPLLLLLSSPWNKSGIVYEHVRDREANPERLVWRAPTLTMNPHANRELMARHRKDRGENFYRREYLAEFSEDSFAFIEPADIDLAIAVGTPFFPSKPGVRYQLGLDPGRLRDRFGKAVAHKEADGTIVVDHACEFKPGLAGLKYFDVLPEVWKTAREYRVKKIYSDQIDFGGIQACIPRLNGVPEFELEREMTGGAAGAELADVTRALFSQHKIVLPDVAGLGEEFKRLSDYLTRGGGRDIRAKKGHDDRSRAVMLAVYRAYLQPRRTNPICEFLPLATPYPKNANDLNNPWNDFGFDRAPRGPSFGRGR